MAHIFIPRAQEAEKGGSPSKFKASLVYRVSSRTVKVIQTNSCLKNKKVIYEANKAESIQGENHGFVVSKYMKD